MGRAEARPSERKHVGLEELNARPWLMAASLCDAGHTKQNNRSRASDRCACRAKRPTAVTDSSQSGRCSRNDVVCAVAVSRRIMSDETAPNKNPAPGDAGF